ncbi:MAG: glycosyltransferase family 4 protein [Candidatus Diapherotrites archaeon]
MKIAYVVSGYAPQLGGAELYTQGVAERLAKRGHDVSVITSRPAGYAHFEEINGIKVYRLRGTRLLFGKMALYPELRATIGKIMPDALHCIGHGHLYSIGAAGAASKLGIPLFMHTYGPLSAHTQRGILEKALCGIYDCIVTPRLFRNAKAVLYRTPGSGEWCISKGAKKALLGTTGIDETFFAKTKNKNRGRSSKVVGFVGTICRRKGVQSLVDAAPEVIKRHMGAEFVIVGSGNAETDKNFEAELRERVREHGISGAFKFMEPIMPDSPENKKKIARLFDSFDVFVLPSEFEAPAQAMLQAMARGKPVVVAGIPMLRGIVGDENALFINPGDSGMLAEKISALLADSALRKRMGEANIKAAGKFSLERIAAELEKVYGGF